MATRSLIVIVPVLLCGCAFRAQEPSPVLPPDNSMGETSTRLSSPTNAPAQTRTTSRLTIAPQTPDAEDETPTTPSTPAHAQPSGYKTFSSTQLGIAFDYPPDWQAQEQLQEHTVLLTSLFGAPIHLARVDRENMQDWLESQDLPNNRCTLRTNTHGTQMQVCADTVTFIYVANFIVVVNGTEHLWTLSARIFKPNLRAVVDMLLDSLRTP